MTKSVSQGREGDNNTKRKWIRVGKKDGKREMREKERIIGEEYKYKKWARERELGMKL